MTVPMALLALLDAGPSHGFDLKRRYDSLLGLGHELKYGQVYATLQRLERDGLAAGVGIQSGAGPDRRVYAITESGVSELETWLASASASPVRRDDVFARVVLALVSGRSPDSVLDSHRRVYLDRMRQLTAGRGAGDAIARLAADYEIAHLEADMQWIELAASRLDAARQAAQAAAVPDGRRGGLDGQQEMPGQL
ncbi:MAG: PadR family transcriptional regulator [Bifidobacteriaceae bacterium]|jgi:DNA-binding PadR family transcriptional regulator|nr:PadR family transcriptional regulator [Bifidobacteriaceae bacterium]